MRHIRDYLWAETPSQALEWLTTRPGRGAFLGGGTALATRQDAGLDFIVDLSRAGLGSIEALTDGVLVGATVPLQRILADSRLAGLGDGILATALGATRTDPWRRQATLAGRLLEGDPGDLVALVLLALGASSGILRPGDAEPVWFDLAAGLELSRAPAPGVAALASTPSPRPVPGLVTAVKLAWPQPGWNFALERVARSSLDTPLAAVAVGVRLEGGRTAEARIATLAGPLPRRAPQAEAALRQSPPGQFESSVTALRSEIEPADDWRASAAYRRHVTGVLLARALRRALAPQALGSP